MQGERRKWAQKRVSQCLDCVYNKRLEHKETAGEIIDLIIYSLAVQKM